MNQSICASLNLFQGTEEQMHFHEMGKSIQYIDHKFGKHFTDFTILGSFTLYPLFWVSVIVMVLYKKCLELPNVLNSNTQ